MMNRVRVLCLTVLWTCTFGLNTEFNVQHPAGSMLCSEIHRKRGKCKSVFYDVQTFSCCLQNRSTYILPHQTRKGSKMFCLRKVSMCIPICDESCDGLTQISSVSLCRENGLNGLCNITDERHSYLLQQLITEALPKGVQVIDQSNRNQKLHHACEVGNLCMVKYILWKGLSDINCRGKLGRTPVMVAARMRGFEVFDFLVNHSCDLSAVDENKDNVLHMACIGGKTDIVRKLIFNVKYHVECKGENGWTPLMYAAYYGHREILDLLVDKGCILEVVADDKNNLLHVACLGGHVDIVKYILSMKVVGTDDTGRNGRTPSMMAAEKGHLGVVKYLVNKGANLKAVDDIKDNILHVACLNGHVDIVKYILSMHVIGIDTTGQCGGTPVMKAVWSGHLNLVKFLVSKACNLKAIDDNKDNVLHVACVSGHVDIVKYILSKQIVAMEDGGWHGRTPVMRAAGKGHVEVVKILVSKDCNLKAIDDNRNTILHVACVSGHVDMVKYILSTKVVGTDDTGRNGRTPLMMAAEKGHLGVVKYLVNKGANVKAVDDIKDNILHVACLNGHVDIVKYILSIHVIGIDNKGQCGGTPVMKAVWSGHLSLVKFLVSKACNLKAIDDNKDNVLHVACVGGNVDIVKYILSKQIVAMEDGGWHGRTPVMRAAGKGHVEVVKFLVSKDCNLKAIDDNRDTILHVACISGHVEMVKYILSMPIDAMEELGWHGRTPVMRAAGRGHVSVVKFLVSKGCNLKAIDDNKDNILHVACAGGHVDMVKYILSKQVVDIDSKGLYGRTPVMRAAGAGCIKVVKFLVSKGCNLRARDSGRNNALHVACTSGHVDMIKYLFTLRFDRKEKNMNGVQSDTLGICKRSHLL